MFEYNMLMKCIKSKFVYYELRKLTLINAHTTYIMEKHKTSLSNNEFIRIYDQLNQIAILVVLQMMGSTLRARDAQCESAHNSNSSCLVAGDLKS